MEKLKGRIFDDPKILQLLKNTDLITVLTVLESESWKSFMLIVENFESNHKATNHENFFLNIITNFQTLRATMYTTIDYLHNHLEIFYDNPRNYYEEQRDRFHQNLKKRLSTGKL